MSDSKFPCKKQGEKIASIRKELNLTVEQVSIQVHVSPRTWERFESGQNSIIENIWHLFCILNQLDYSKLYFKKIYNLEKNIQFNLKEAESNLNLCGNSVLTKLRNISGKSIFESANQVHININFWLEYEKKIKPTPESLVHLFCLLNGIDYSIFRSDNLKKLKINLINNGKFSMEQCYEDKE